MVQAPAKVNLSLLVGPPGKDGYHTLFTIFVPLTLADELEVELEVTPRAGVWGSGAVAARDAGSRAPAGRSTLNAPGVAAVQSRLEVVCAGVSWADNLVTRSLLEVEKATGCEFSGRVIVRKNIPTGAGLGGGSSDAAATLRVATEMVAKAGGPSLPPSQLHGLARGLGADVPFFLDPRPALASGVGDLLEPLELPSLPLALLLPRRELSTAEVYRTFDGMGVAESSVGFQERLLRAESDWRGLSSAWSSGGLDAEGFGLGLAGLLQNDLEPASLQLMPELASDRAGLDGEGVLGALMSGSGPTFFALCASTEAAEATAERLRARGRVALAVSTWGGGRGHVPQGERGRPTLP
jgi:4-diphosphocytidyl-2-C-methyl-D-erythritol kinase